MSLNNFDKWKKSLEAGLTPEEVKKVSPVHYKRLKPEPIEVIESWGLAFHPAQVLKYIARAGHKDDILSDLKKARFYLDRWIAQVEGEKPR